MDNDCSHPALNLLVVKPADKSFNPKVLNDSSLFNNYQLSISRKNPNIMMDGRVAVSNEISDEISDEKEQLLGSKGCVADSGNKIDIEFVNRESNINSNQHTAFRAKLETISNFEEQRVFDVSSVEIDSANNNQLTNNSVQEIVQPVASLTQYDSVQENSSVCMAESKREEFEDPLMTSFRSKQETTLSPLVKFPVKLSVKLPVKLSENLLEKPSTKLPTKFPTKSNISEDKQSDTSFEENVSPRRNKNREKIDFNHVLGIGSFSKVYLGKHKERQVAVKIVSYDELNKKNLLMGTKIKEQLARELEIIKILHARPHPNIVTYYKIRKSPEKLVVIMELCAKKDLSRYIKSLDFVKVRSYYSQILSGYSHLASLKIVHRDIKAANILVSYDEKVVKIADFGFSKIMTMDLTRTICGSPLYMAPELYNNEDYDNKADIWSLGILLYEMIYGVTPFHACKDIEILSEIIQSNPTIDFPRKSYGKKYVVSENIIEYMRKLLTLDPFQRIGINGLYDTDWLDADIVNYQGSLNFDPKSDQKITKINSLSNKINNREVVNNNGKPFHQKQSSPSPLKRMMFDEIDENCSETDVFNSDDDMLFEQSKKNDTKTTIPRSNNESILKKPNLFDDDNQEFKFEETLTKQTLQKENRTQKGLLKDQLIRAKKINPVTESQSVNKLDENYPPNIISSYVHRKNTIAEKVRQSNNNSNRNIPINAQSLTRGNRSDSIPIHRTQNSVNQRNIPLNYSPRNGEMMPHQQKQHHMRIGSCPDIFQHPFKRTHSDEIKCESLDNVLGVEQGVDRLEQKDVPLGEISFVDDIDYREIFEQYQIKLSVSGFVDIDDVDRIPIAIPNAQEKSTNYEYFKTSPSALSSYLYSKSAPSIASFLNSFGRMAMKAVGSIGNVVPSRQ